jgi:sigma-B regulation protein RsbU (phosphoserine phosphatase)
MTERIEIQRVLDYVVESVVQSTNAEAGSALLVDEYDDVLRVRSVRGFFPPPYEIPEITKRKLAGVEEYFRSQPIEIGETVLGEAVEQGEPIFIRDTSLDDRMIANTSDDTCYVSSLMAIPLLVEKRVFGVLSVITRQREMRFSPADFERAKIFAEYASLTLENLYNYMQLLEKQEIEREVGIAAQIQRQLQPSRIPRVKGAELAAYSLPARGVSGDYYDILRLTKDGKFGLVVCDVAGKGVPASLVMVMIRTIIHLVAGSGRDAATIVNWINRGIAGQVDIDRFATLSVITYDPKARLLEYSNAAHHPAIIFHSTTGEAERIDTEGLPIGLEREVWYGKVERSLAPGDFVVLYTDGVVEAMNVAKEQFGEDRLLAAVARHAAGGPSELLSGITTEMNEFVGRAKQQDDQTLLAMKVSG